MDDDDDPLTSDLRRQLRDLSASSGGAHERLASGDVAAQRKRDVELDFVQVSSMC